MEGTVHQGVLRVAVQVGLRQLPHIYIILKRLLHSNAWKHKLAVQYSLYSIIDHGDNNLVREKACSPNKFDQRECRFLVLLTHLLDSKSCL